MKDLSLFPDENAKNQEERSALSSSPLQAKFKKTRRKSALTTISAEDEMRRVNGMWELKKVMKDAVLDNLVPNEREPLMALLMNKAREMGLIQP